MNYGLTWALAIGDDRLLTRCLVVAPAKEVAYLLALWATNNVVLIVPFLLGAFYITWQVCRRSGDHHRSLLVPLALVVQPLAWAVATDFHRGYGPFFQSQRYVANVGPLYLIVGLVGAWRLVQRLRPDRRRLAWIAVVALALVASVVRHRDQVDLYTTNVKNITELQVETARWIRDNLPRDAVLAVNDVGAIGVITDCRVHDMMGLVSRETLACLTVEKFRDGTWRDCRRDAFIAAEPDYFVANATPDGVGAYAANPYFDQLIYDTEIEDNITAGGSMMVIFRTVWCGDPPVSDRLISDAPGRADGMP
jgi:hypothetical protein